MARKLFSIPTASKKSVRGSLHYFTKSSMPAGKNCHGVAHYPLGYDLSASNETLPIEVTSGPFTGWLMLLDKKHELVDPLSIEQCFSIGVVLLRPDAWEKKVV